MENWLDNIFRNLNCTYCQDYIYVNPEYVDENGEIRNVEENNEKETKVEKNGWNLYIKEFESYSALILYHPIYKKDVIEIFETENIYLYDENGNKIMKLEFVNSLEMEKEKTSIWVPGENYYAFYERLLEMKKKYDKDIEAYFVGSYNIDCVK